MNRIDEMEKGSKDFSEELAQLKDSRKIESPKLAEFGKDVEAAKAELEDTLSRGKDSKASEKKYRDVSDRFWIQERKMKGIEDRIAKTENIVANFERALRQERRDLYVKEAGKILKKIQEIESKQLLSLVWDLAAIEEGIESNIGNSEQRYRIDSVKVVYTDPKIVGAKGEKKPKTKNVGVKLEEGEVVIPEEGFAVDPKNPVSEWIPYETARRLAREKRAKIVEEKKPEYDSRRVFEPEPGIMDDLRKVHLGVPVSIGNVLPPEFEAIRKRFGYFEFDVTTVGRTMTKKEIREYLKGLEK